MFRRWEKRDEKSDKGWILNTYAHGFLTQSTVEIPVSQKYLLRRRTSLTKESLIAVSVLLSPVLVNTFFFSKPFARERIPFGLILYR